MFLVTFESVAPGPIALVTSSNAGARPPRYPGFTHLSRFGSSSLRLYALRVIHHQLFVCHLSFVNRCLRRFELYEYGDLAGSNALFLRQTIPKWLREPFHGDLEYCTVPVAICHQSLLLCRLS